MKNWWRTTTPVRRQKGSDPRGSRNQRGEELQRTQLHPLTLRCLFNSSLGSDGVLCFALSVNAYEVGAGCSLSAFRAAVFMNLTLTCGLGSP